MQKRPDQNVMAHSRRTNALLILLTLMFSAVFGTVVKASADEEGLDRVVAKLLAIRPGLPIESIYPAAVEGLYGVDFPDGTTMYVTADGEHMIVGDMYAIGDDLSNVTEQRRVAQRRRYRATLTRGALRGAHGSRRPRSTRCLAQRPGL